MVMLLFSAIWLSYVSKKQMDPNYQKNWWVLSFDNPKDNSLSFTIENHSNNNNFHWQILSEKTVVNQGDVTIKLGESKTIPATLPDTAGKKTTVVVTAGEEKKEIYKILQ